MGLNDPAQWCGAGRGRWRWAAGAWVIIALVLVEAAADAHGVSMDNPTTLPWALYAFGPVLVGVGFVALIVWYAVDAVRWLWRLRRRP